MIVIVGLVVLLAAVMVGLTGARWVGHTDVKGELPARPVVRFRPERASAFIGLEVPPEEQHEILANLGLERQNGHYVVPTWRARDLTREVDLVEVARLAGMPFTLPVRQEMDGRLPDATLRCGSARHVVARFSETYTPSLVGRTRMSRRAAREPHLRGARRHADGPASRCSGGKPCGSGERVSCSESPASASRG
jgi:phenylalanyl-tRNA synthetase beta subunit